MLIDGAALPCLSRWVTRACRESQPDSLIAKRIRDAMERAPQRRAHATVPWPAMQVDGVGSALRRVRAASACQASCDDLGRIIFIMLIDGAALPCLSRDVQWASVGNSNKFESTPNTPCRKNRQIWIFDF